MPRGGGPAADLPSASGRDPKVPRLTLAPMKQAPMYSRKIDFGLSSYKAGGSGEHTFSEPNEETTQLILSKKIG